MDDVLRVVILIGSLIGLGVGTYAGVSVVFNQHESERLPSGRPLGHQ